MITVFQGETGGTISFKVSTASAISGYMDLISTQRVVHRFMGYITSGNLYIAKSGIAQFNPGAYLCMPQVNDVSGLVYFLDPSDLQVIEVPPYSIG